MPFVGPNDPTPTAQPTLVADLDELLTEVALGERHWLDVPEPVMSWYRAGAVAPDGRTIAELLAEIEQLKHELNLWYDRAVVLGPENLARAEAAIHDRYLRNSRGETESGSSPSVIDDLFS